MLWPLRPPRTLLAAPLAALLALAACGGDEPVRATDREIEIRLDEYRLIPQAVRAPAGRLTLRGHNIGRLTHNLAVQEVPENSEQRSETIARTPTAHPGQTVQESVRLRPGTYRLACTIANHDDLGMYGTLEVVEGG